MFTKVLYIPWLVEALSFVIPASAITIGPFVLTKLPDFKDRPRIMRHEFTHSAQYLECFFFGFLLLYLIDFLRGLYLYKDKEMAYFAIRFEQEARDAEKITNYLEKREHYAWTRYRVDSYYEV